MDPKREQIGARPLWVRLPGLPLQYWCEEVFVRIGNALGTYLNHDRTFVQSKNRTLARILVHMDTREGLEEKITLQWGKYSWVQILDYEEVPFRCRRCHRVGHIFKECPLMKKLEDPPRAPTTTIGPDAPAQNCSPSSIPQPPVSNTTRTAEGEYRTPSSPLTRARAAAEAGKILGYSSDLLPFLICFQIFT